MLHRGLISFFSPLPRPPTSPLFPYTTLFRSISTAGAPATSTTTTAAAPAASRGHTASPDSGLCPGNRDDRSEEHTSELQSRFDLVCRLLLEKKKSASPRYPKR